MYVDDVADDKAGAGAYFLFCSDAAMLTSTLTTSVAECSVEDTPVDCMPNVSKKSEPGEFSLNPNAW